MAACIALCAVDLDVSAMYAYDTAPRVYRLLLNASGWFYAYNKPNPYVDFASLLFL